jgi:hypothetical protein
VGLVLDPPEPLDLPPLPEPPVLDLPPLPEPPVLDAPPLPEPPVLDLPPLPEPPVLDAPPLPEPPVLDAPPLPEPPLPPPGELDEQEIPNSANAETVSAKTERLESICPSLVHFQRLRTTLASTLEYPRAGHASLAKYDVQYPGIHLPHEPYPTCSG